MSNRKKTKAEMKKIYFMRRLVALLVLVLIITLIATRCVKRSSEKEGNPNSLENQPIGENQVVGNVNDPNLENPTDLNNNSDEEDDLNRRLAEEETNLQKDYETYAQVTLDKENKAYLFNLKDEYRDLVLNRESEEVKEDFKQFWENFKYKLKESSTNLSEFLEPGIELQILDPIDDATVILMISDGAELFDRTAE